MVLSYLKKVDHHCSSWMRVRRSASHDSGQVNRPLGSTDISANLKAKVSKAVAQKALVALAEKGQLTRKDYGQRSPFHLTRRHLPLTVSLRL